MLKSMLIHVSKKELHVIDDNDDDVMTKTFFPH